MRTILSGHAARRVMLAAIVAAVIPSGAFAQQDPSPQASQTQLGLLPEPQFISRAIDFATRTMGDGGREKSGLYPEMSNMITGAGWISLGPGYRQWLGGDRVFFDLSAGLSWREYKMARAQVELTNLAKSRLAVGAESKWFDYTQNTYFGDGADSLESNRTEYRLKTLDTVGYANLRPGPRWLTIGARAGWLRSPSLLDPVGRFRRDNPSTIAFFPEESACTLGDQPDYLHGELSVTADTRDHRSHALRGGLYRGAWTGFSDRDQDGSFSFRRFEVEGAQFTSTRDGQVTVALHSWFVTSNPVEGDHLPFYLMPSLGGNNTVRAFANFRFHDWHMLVANAELRIALWSHLDSVLFMDAGNVAARVADLDFDKRAVGFGFRLHSDRATFARVDLARGTEGWRLTVSTSDPLHLSRLSRKIAAIPFVP